MSELRYKLYASNDLGCVYEQITDVDPKLGETEDGFKDIIDILEGSGARWYLESPEGKVLKYGKFQKAYIDMVVKQTREDGKEDALVTTDDMMVKKVLLEEYGIESVDSTDIIMRMTGLPREEVLEMQASAPSPMSMTKEEKERLIAKMQKMEEDGVITIHDDSNEEIRNDSSTKH